ncbi:MAG: discoidin domain-containing protein [Brumimicrobium sp.]|nr:discoidin domain-containing protein [Brumimicrobium sp.]
MKKVITFILTTLITTYTYAQCDNLPIPKTAWTIHYVDSEETTGEGANNGKAIYAIDGDTTKFWHTQWQNAQPGYPHEIQINLGNSYDVSGFSLLSRFDNPYGKPKDYEVYLSMDGSDWQTAQSVGELTYPNINAAAQRTYVYFGAVTAQYIRFNFLTPYDNNYYTILSEIDVYESTTCPATGQVNQLASFQTISKKYTTDAPFQVVATTNSSLPITFQILSGPATITGNEVTLTGTGGQVTIKASQAGDATYYPWEAVQTFDVVDLTTISPVITTRFIENEDVKMPTLSAYLLHAYASIDEPDALEISKVEYEIEGTKYLATLVDNSYQYWWTPSAFGPNEIKVIATASNGTVTTETYTLNVSNDIQDRSVMTFTNGVIDMGTIGSQWYFGTYDMPQFTGAYDEIIADFSISCPGVPGGCDDWDRLGWVEVKAPNGDWMEIFRYITPYGKACSDFTDVTDLASILQGKVEFRMYIETWGTGGWKLNLSLDYRAGTPKYKYSSVEELWHGDFSFGNPADLQPVPVISSSIQHEVDSALIRLISTGHGWGQNNSLNAAEFYHAIHHIDVNGVNTFDQDLWQKCNPNPASCSPQSGTWQYDRAGWCPGSMGMIFNYNLKPYLNNNTISLGYVFQEDYKDFCHPNNPNCISGATCPDCNDGYNPYYHVGGYLIKYSNDPFVLNVPSFKESKELSAVLYPNPTQHTFKLNIQDQWKNLVVSVYDITGQIIQVKYFNTEMDVNQYEFDLSILPNGMYFVKIQSEGSFANVKVLKQ